MVNAGLTLPSDEERHAIRRRTLWVFSDAKLKNRAYDTAGLGAVVLSGLGKLRAEQSAVAVGVPVNVAELLGVELGLQTALGYANDPMQYNVICYTDSSVALDYLHGNGKGLTRLQEVRDRVWALGQKFRSVRYRHAPRTTTTIRRCETLARRELQAKGIKLHRARGSTTRNKRKGRKVWNPYGDLDGPY